MRSYQLLGSKGSTGCVWFGVECEARPRNHWPPLSVEVACPALKCASLKTWLVFKRIPVTQPTSRVKARGHGVLCIMAEWPGDTQLGFVQGCGDRLHDMNGPADGIEAGGGGKKEPPVNDSGRDKTEASV